MLNIAVIGLGWWGRTIVDVVRGSSKLRVVRVADLDPKAQAHIVGIDQLLLGPQRVHQRNLAEPLLVGADARARVLIFHRLGGLDDGLPRLGSDRKRLVEIEHARGRPRRNTHCFGDFPQRNHNCPTAKSALLRQEGPVSASANNWKFYKR